MRKPLFNDIERRIMQKDKSLFASTMKLYIATKKFEKVFMKTLFGTCIKITITRLACVLSLLLKTN